MVCSDADYIVFSHTDGLLAERSEFESARQFWETELARHAERGHNSDALVFRWADDQWAMVGDLYDLHVEGFAQPPPAR